MKRRLEDWLAPTRLRWPQPDGPWDLVLHWRLGAEAVECVGWEFRLRQDATLQPLTATQIRAVRLQEVIREAKAEKFSSAGGDLVQAYESDPDDPGFEELSPSVLAQLRSAIGAWQDETKAGRPVDRGPDHFAEVARVYSLALAAGLPPTLAVMQQLGPVGKATASRWVRGARDAGLLPPTTRGRAVGGAVLGNDEVKP